MSPREAGDAPAVLKAASKLRGHKVAATLTITFKRSGSTSFKFVRQVKIV